MSTRPGPAIRPSWEITDPYDLGIELTIRRDGAVAWHGQASTASLRRRFDDLVGYLMRADIHPDGVVLSTGTCLVPPMPFTLDEGHVVRISVSEVGTLENPVVRGLAAIAPALDSGSRCRLSTPAGPSLFTSGPDCAALRVTGLPAQTPQIMII